MVIMRSLGKILSGFSAKGVVLEQMLYEIYVNRIDKIVFFDDVLPTLVELKNKGYKLALLTNTENLTFEKIEAKLKLSNYFDFLGLSYEIGEIKPNPKMFEAVVNHFGVKPSECLMVGDSLRSDITGAKNFGIPSVWINRPKKSFDFAEIKPDFELSTLRILIKCLRGWEMVSEVEKRRKIDKILSPQIKKANEMATELKLKSDKLKVEMERASAMVKASKLRNAKRTKLARHKLRKQGCEW